MHLGFPAYVPRTQSAGLAIASPTPSVSSRWPSGESRAPRDAATPDRPVGAAGRAAFKHMRAPLPYEYTARAGSASFES